MTLFSVCERPREIPFTLPPRFMTQNKCDLKEEEEIKMEARRDILAHRGSLSVSSRSLLPLFDSMSRWLSHLWNFKVNFKPEFKDSTGVCVT